MALPDMKRLEALKEELGKDESDLGKTIELLRPPIPEEEATQQVQGRPSSTMSPPPVPAPSRLPPERAMGPPPDMSGRLPPQLATIPPGQLSRQKVNLNNILFREPNPPAMKALANLSERSGQGVEQPIQQQLTYGDIIKNLNQVENIGLRSEVGTIPLATGGGLIDLAAGGEFSGRVPGDGGGMEDNVRMSIKEGDKQVATLGVSPTEYVVDSHTMAALGNGNPNEGADVMDETVKQIRRKAYGTDKQPNEISGLASLKPLVDRVG